MVLHHSFGLAASTQQSMSGWQPNFMIYSFIGFFVGKFVANFLMTRFSANKVLVAYSIIGCVVLLYVSFVPNMTALWANVLSVLLDHAGLLFMQKLSSP